MSGFGRGRAVVRTVLVGTVSAWVAAGLAVLPAPVALAAATFTVNSTTDAVDASPGNGTCATSGGACTLRAAVMEANATPGSDTITLPAGTYTLTVGPRDDEQSGTNNNHAAGDLDILHLAAAPDSNNDLTINGAGLGSTIINGGGIDRVFDVDPTQFSPGGDAHGLDVTITNLTITGGRTLENVNDTTGTGNAFADGAGIRFDGFHDTNRGSLTLTNVAVTGNTADHNGGGLYFSYGDLSISGSTFSNNIAEAGEGGGIWVANSPGYATTIANSTISGNRALRDIYLPGLTTDVVGGDGGGLSSNVGASLTITNTAIANNIAERDGGGIDANTRTISISGTTLTGNKAGGHAGGIYLDPDTSGFPTAGATLTNLTVHSNTADATVAGVVSADGTGTGGGIYHRGGKLTMTSSTIGGSGVGNSAVRGGGLAFDNDPSETTTATSDVRKNQILANSASSSGGGIWVGAGTFTARYNRVRNNSAPAGEGLRRDGGGTVDATDNWWGCNSDPTAGDPACDSVSNTPGPGVNPRLALTNTSSPNPIRVTQSTTFTASVLKNSAGTAIPLSDLTVLLGLPLTFGGATLGTISAAGTSTGATGTATATYTAGNTGGPGNVNATVDGAVAPGNIEVHEPPNITVPANKTVTEDAPHSKIANVPFSVTSTGYPAVTVTCSIGGTQIATGLAPLNKSHNFPQGVSTVECTGANGVSPVSTKSFDVTVQTAPVLTVPADITVTEDAPNGNTASVNFSASTDSYPNATITCMVGGTTIGSGPTPLSVTHTFGAGLNTVDCSAANGIDPVANESFTVTVNTLPVLTVPADIEVTEDTEGSGVAEVAWSTAATGTPAPSISCTLGGNPVTSPHTFPLGDNLVTCTATNSVGSDVESFHVIVNPANAVPTIVTGGPYAVAEGGSVGLDASGTTDDDGDVFTIEWDLDNDGTYDVTGVMATFDASGIDGPASRTVGVRATDARGGVSTATTEVTISNVAPTSSLSNGGPVAEGSTGTVSFTGSDDAALADELAGFAYSWDFDNDGTFDVVDSPTATATVPASYLDDGPATRTVLGRVSDDDGGFTEYTTDIDVTNVAPTGTLDNTGPVAEGGAPMVDFTTVTDPSTADTAALTYDYDYDNDGTWDLTNSSLGASTVPSSYVDDGPGSLTVRARVNDDDGGFTEYTTTITITNAAPTAVAANDGPVAEGSPAGVSLGSPADPSNADTAAGFTYSFDYDNDGTFEVTDNASPSATVPGSYLDDGPGMYEVGLRITDKDGGFTNYVTEIAVGNVAPTGTLSNDGPVAENSAATLTFTDVVDPSAGDTASGFLYSWDFDNDGTFEVTDSSTPSASVPASLLPDGPATHEARGRISDKDGGFSDYTTTINVTNVAPTATIANDGPVAEHTGATVSLSGPADASPADAAAGFTYSWDFDNDGTFDVVDSASPSAAVPASMLDDNGAHDVRGRIADKDGGFTDYVTTITVTSVAPTATLGNGGPAAEGSTTTVGFTGASDPSNADTAAGFAYSWDFDNDGTFDVTGASTASETVPASYLNDGPGTRTVRGRIADKDGAFTDYTTGITITNVVPEAVVAGSHDARNNSTYAPLFGAVDPSPADQAATFTYVVNWGDGSAPQTVSGPSSLTIPHVYLNTGDYTITVTATDKDGGVSPVTSWHVTVNGSQVINDSCTGGTTLVVSGGTGDDVIEIKPSGTNVQVFINNQNRGVFNPSGRLILNGRGGDDIIVVDQTISLRQLIYGGLGNDWVAGGNGRLMFVGGDGDDVAYAGNNRDILLGGLGADTLDGDNGDDILIAGPTAYDGDSAADRASLCRIEREWSRNDASYSARYNHLRGATAGGLNGTDYLRGPGSGQTVFSDNSVDLLSGRNGNDWFLYNRYAPGVHDSADVSGSEFGSDL